MKSRLFDTVAGLLAGLLVTVSASAQSDKPVSLVVGYSAGGSADFVARVVGEELSKRLGRQVVIENVAGASGMLAAQKVMSGPSDGSVIYMGGTDSVLVPMINPKAKLDWEKDLVPIGRTTTVPMIFVVPSDSPYATLSDIVKALCMGATGVCIGRPYIWGLGAFGQPGVERVLELLRLELSGMMQQMGAPTIKHLTPAMVRRV